MPTTGETALIVGGGLVGGWFLLRALSDGHPQTPGGPAPVITPSAAQGGGGFEGGLLGGLLAGILSAPQALASTAQNAASDATGGRIPPSNGDTGRFPGGPGGTPTPPILYNRRTGQPAGVLPTFPKADLPATENAPQGRFRAQTVTPFYREIARQYTPDRVVNPDGGLADQTITLIGRDRYNPRVGFYAVPEGEEE